MKKVAIIDIGSNSIRLMIKDEKHTISKWVKSTRLSAGFDGKLQKDRMILTANAINDYVNYAKSEGIADIFIFATEIVRAASNRNEFLKMVYDLTQLEVEVVAPNIEAKLGFSGAYNGVTPVAVVDIGGASTEITVGDATQIMYTKSVPIGCVRMKDRCGEDDLMLDEYIDESISKYGKIPPVDSVIFVAGTASTVATMKLGIDKYDASKVDNLEITRSSVVEIMNKLKKTPLEDRNNIHGLPAQRKDIIYGGMRLIVAILDKLKVDNFTFSDSDSLEGYLKYLIATNRFAF